MMTRSSRLIVFATALTLIATLAGVSVAEAQGRPYLGDDSVRFRLGLFEPDGDSAYWFDNQDVFGSLPEDFEDVSFGVDYVRHVGDRFGLMLSAGGTDLEEELAYLDFVDEFGSDIFHDTRLETGHLTAGLILYLAGRRNTFVPYVGVGAGFYGWTLEEEGDFIDFFVQPEEIFTGFFEDSGTTIGYYYMGGIEVRLGAQWSFLAEARVHQADDELGGDFEGLGNLDLSGRELSAGLTWRF